MSDGESCACGGSCGCGNHEETQQVYLTREEYISRLQEYLVQLTAEMKSVEEELAELRETA
jgi:hypothetical protein